MISMKFLRKSLQKWFPTQLNSMAKIFRRAVIQGSLALNFEWNVLTAWILRKTHAFLTGWYLFTIFTVAPFWCTPPVILDFCFTLLATNTAIWANLVGTHRSKLEVEDFIFHVEVFSRETCHVLAWKFLLCIPQKVFGVYFS